MLTELTFMRIFRFNLTNQRRERMKIPCVNTIELNRYLDECDQAEARGEYICKIADDLLEDLYSDQEDIELVAEALMDSDDELDIKLVIDCIKNGYINRSIEIVVQSGTENCPECIEEIIAEYDKLHESAKAIIDTVSEEVTLKLAEKQVEAEELAGPDYDGE